MQRLRLISLRTRSAIAIVKVPSGQEDWLLEAMVEGALFRSRVARVASVRSYADVVAAASRHLEVAML